MNREDRIKESLQFAVSEGRMLVNDARYVMQLMDTIEESKSQIKLAINLHKALGTRYGDSIVKEILKSLNNSSYDKGMGSNP
jgi:hypothetical protein